MQTWVVICLGVIALVGADECPDGGRCEEGQTCCNSPLDGYECCPFDQAECCEDHIHCCPSDTICNPNMSSCVNATVSIPWKERVSALQPTVSKSFRMIKTHMGEEDDNICPDQSRCPAEFSCLKALTKFGCCPLAKGISCSDGKHCCPEDHKCSTNSRSCIKKDLVTAVLCSDGKSECPDETTCCESPEGGWGCCPMPKAVCCDDKKHCCPDGTTCNIGQMKCISVFTKKELPMWAKFPARLRADWENHKEDKDITAKTADDETEKSSEVTTANPVPSLEEEVTVSSVTKEDGVYTVPCNETAACPDGTTCCKTKEGGWACCSWPEAVCCEDFLHCCPKGKKCNLAAQTCEDGLLSVPWFEKKPAISRLRVKVLMKDVPCDDTTACPDGSTCCKTKEGTWACCPLPKAVCCDDHEHCCPEGTTCNPTSTSCIQASGTTAIMQNVSMLTPTVSTMVETTTQSLVVSTAETSEEEELHPEESDDDDEEEKDSREVEEKTQCDEHTSCPRDTTCCFMASSEKWGCCPLPKAVCCADGGHCCPENYKCKEDKTSCVRGDVEIPWYAKISAISSIQADSSNVQCDNDHRCPVQTSCCKLFTGEWGCCPLQNAVCCSDKEHCCPQGYKCDVLSKTCQKVIMLQLETVPLTPVYLPEYHLQLTPLKHKDVPCDEQTSCPDDETCCRTSATTWGCCPSPKAVCCSDMKHCCPTGSTCTEEGSCTQNSGLNWQNWDMFLANKKRALVL